MVCSLLSASVAPGWVTLITTTVHHPVMRKAVVDSDKALGELGSPAFRVAEERFSLPDLVLRAAAFCDFDLFGIPLVRLLRDMGIACLSPTGFHRGDVDVLGGRKHCGVLGDLVVVQRKCLAGL